MSNVKEMRIFAAEQIEVPDEFPGILKNFVKAVVRAQPENMVEFSRKYFENLKTTKKPVGAADRQRIVTNPKEFYLSHKDNIKDHYILHETIGEGALSRVRRGVHRSTGFTRAIKVVKKEDLEFGERRKLLDEIELLKELDHINIGRVFEMYEDNKKIYFVNEMCQGGTLFDNIMHDHSFNELKAANIMKQLFSAVYYLHDNNIVHGDLQPKNIHFAKPENDLVKIIDFGTSRRINEQHAMHGVFGTAMYNAPEVIEGEYSEKCDLWSLGVLMYIILSGESPFEAETDAEMVDLVKRGQFDMEGPVWEQISDEAKDLI